MLSVRIIVLIILAVSLSFIGCNGNQNFKRKETIQNRDTFTIQLYSDTHAFEKYSYFWVTSAAWKLFAFARGYSILVENDITVKEKCSKIIQKLDSLTTCFLLKRWKDFRTGFIVTLDMDTMPIHITKSVDLDYYSDLMGENDHVLFGEDSKAGNCWTYKWDLEKWRRWGIPLCPPIASFMVVRNSHLGKLFIQEWYDRMTNATICPYADDLSHPYEQKVMWFCMDWNRWKNHVKILPERQHDAIANKLYLHWGTKKPKPVWQMEKMWNGYGDYIDNKSDVYEFYRDQSRKMQEIQNI